MAKYLTQIRVNLTKLDWCNFPLTKGGDRERDAVAARGGAGAAAAAQGGDGADADGRDDADAAGRGGAHVQEGLGVPGHRPLPAGLQSHSALHHHSSVFRINLTAPLLPLVLLHFSLKDFRYRSHYGILICIVH